MKFVGFVSSPEKNGNTHRLVNHALEIVKSKGHDVELVLINSMKISGCQSCHYCKSNSRCSIQDDFQKIYDLINEGDKFIFSSPVYFFDINAQAKLVEDRLYSIIDKDHKTKLNSQKECVFIYSQGVPDIHAFESNLIKHETAMKMIGINPVGKLISSGIINDESKDLIEVEKLVKLLL